MGTSPKYDPLSSTEGLPRDKHVVHELQTMLAAQGLDLGKGGIDDRMGKDTAKALHSLPQEEQGKMLARAQLAAQLKHPEAYKGIDALAFSDSVRNPAPPPALKTQQAAAPAAPLPAHKGTIVIDPGHGGLIPLKSGALVNDPGVVTSYDGKQLTESHLNQAMAGELADALRARGYDVVLTKNTEKTKDVDRVPGGNAFVMGERRTGKAPDAIAFVSIHQDERLDFDGKLPKTEAARAKMRGVTVNNHPEGRDVDRLFAQQVASKFDRKPVTHAGKVRVLDPDFHHGQGAPSNGVKKGASFERPAILVETSNFSDPKDVATIMDPAQRAALVDKLADGIDAGLQSPKLRMAMGLPKAKTQVAAADLPADKHTAAPLAPAATTPEQIKTGTTKVQSTRIVAQNQQQASNGSAFGFLGKFSPF